MPVYPGQASPCAIPFPLGHRGPYHCSVLARNPLPEAFVIWNRANGAPSGRWNPATRALRRVRNLEAAYHLARLLGPFAFQPNSSTRTFEYPWAFQAIGPRPGMRLLEIGGGLSGLQFVLSRLGCEVHNIDPFVDFGLGPYKANPERALVQINRALHTDVRLHRSTLAEAPLAGRFDVIYSVSTLEHMPPTEIEDTVTTARTLLSPGGRIVLTLDLFLDVAPFCSRPTNRWGRNVSTAWIADLFGLNLIAGDCRELYGFEQFSVDHVLGNLSEYVVGTGYPQLAQLVVLGRE